MNLSLIELYNQMGGFAKGIVYVLAIMSIYSLSIMIQKWWYLRSAQAETRKFAPEFSQFLEEDNLSEAINLAVGYKKSHVARVLGNALSEIKPLIQDGSVTVADINSAEPDPGGRLAAPDAVRAEADVLMPPGEDGFHYDGWRVAVAAGARRLRQFRVAAGLHVRRPAEAARRGVRLVA